jgi:hypothetical protein
MERDQIKKALDYLRKKDPNNPTLQSYEKRLRSLTGASEKSAKGSIELYDHYKENFSSAGQKAKQAKNKMSITDLKGNRQSKGYEKEIKRREEESSPRLSVYQQRQSELKKKFGIVAKGDITYTQAQKMARERKEKEQKSKKKDNNDGFWDNVKGFLKGEKVIEGFSIRDKKDGDFDTTMNKVGKVREGEKPTQVDRFIGRAANSASLGLPKELAKRTNDELTLNSYYNDRKMGKGGGADLIADGLGYITPGAAFVKGAQLTKAGANAGAKGIQKALQLGKEGAVVGGTMAGAEVGIREALNGKDTDWKDNAKHVAFGTATGAIADPLIHGAGKAIGKGFEKASEKSMKTLLPNEKEFVDAVIQNKGNTLKPNIKNRPGRTQPETQPKVESPLIEPSKTVRSTEYDQEFEEAVQNQFEYLKNSMGKGVDHGTTSNGLDGNYREVTGTYSVSKNPKWYQEFYALNKRKPTQADLKELAKQHVKEGFEDEFGSLPSWAPKKVQEIDNEIDGIVRMMGENPEEAEVLTPILKALEEDREVLLKSVKQNLPMKVKNHSPENIQALKGTTIPFRQPSGARQFKEMGTMESIFNKLKGNSFEKPISRRELMENMKKNLGVTLRTGRLGKVDSDVQGYFKVNEEIIRTKNHGDIQVLSHEIGHHLDKQFKLTNPQFDNELMKLGQFTSGPNYTPDEIRQEGLAEYIRLYLTDPQRAMSEAPNFFQHFDSALPKNVKKGLLKTQKDVDRWIEQGDYYQAAGKIDHIGEVTSIREMFDKTYSQLIDRFDLAHKIEKEVTGKINEANNSLYKRLRLSAGAPKIAERYLVDLKRILQPIDEYGYNKKEVSRYIAMVHAKDLENMGEKVANEALQEAIDISNAVMHNISKADLSKAIKEFESKYGMEINTAQLNSLQAGKGLNLTKEQLLKISEENRIESGFRKEEIDSVISKLDSPELQQIQKQLVMYSNNLLDILVSSGRLSRQAVDAMRKKHPNYVPFFRYFDDDMASGFGNKGFANLTNPVKRLKGSTRDVIDPLENMIKNTFAIINTAEKNKVGIELLKLSNFQGAGKYVEVVPGDKSLKENVVTVYKDGEPVQLQLDKELHRVIQRMDEESSNIVIKMLSVPAQTLRAGATLTPEFMLRNPIRDQFQAFVVSENGYFPPRDLTIGLWHAIRGKQGKSPIYEQWARTGGGYGNLMSVDRNYLREQLAQLKKEGHPLNRGFKTIANPKEWIKLLGALSELSEEATKLGEFRRATKKGKSLEEAAFESRDLMDFARSGNALREANKVVTFLNANVQGKDKLIRSFKSNPSRFIIKSITGVTLPAIGSYLAMQYLANEKQKETWQNAPGWLKESFFFVPIPGTDVVARIPKPFDLAPLYASPVESLLDHLYQNDPATLEEFAKGTAVSLTKVPYMLTGVAPLIENWANKSFFTEAPIVPMRDQDLLPEEQYGVSTSLTARTIGKYTNYSPYKVDNLIRGYGAGLGKYATSGMDKALQTLNLGKMPPQEKKKWSELPVLNAFTVDSTGGGKVVDEYYNTLEKLRMEYKTAQKREIDYDRVDDYKYLQYKVGKEMSGLNAKYREVLGSYDLSPIEKRRLIDEIDTKRKDLARRALSEIGGK